MSAAGAHPPGTAGTKHRRWRMRPKDTLNALRAYIAPTAAGVGIVSGGLLYAFVGANAADVAWAATVAIMLVPLSWSVLRSLLHGDLGVDIIALLAMAGALALGEYLAGAVIALMLAGGNALEVFASARARRELTALVERAPRSARRRTDDGWEEIPAEQVQVGDILLVRAGEVIPTDGALASERAVIDESSLTGEPLPASYVRGQMIRSGSSNAGDAFELTATQRAADSAYAALVRLVREAEQRRAPFVRMADRYAVYFLPLTLAIAAGAWLVSGDAVRALAVLVVATPCPLILAAPIAFVAGLSRAASAGVIVKGGVAIERLGEARTVLLDKTGTLTLGVPAVEQVLTLDGVAREELLRLAASLDQLSSHVLAAAIVRQASSEAIALARPEHVRESPGQGIEGIVDGHSVVVGSAAWLAGHEIDPTARAAHATGRPDGSASVLVGVDRRLAGVLVMGDHVRPDAHQLVQRLREAGIRHIAMLSGDRADVAQAVSNELGLDRVYAQQSPEDKLDVVRRMRETARLAPVVMVGDGINDAPALAMADVGVAMGGAGATVSAETADAVITVDRIDRVADAIAIGRRTVRIARESVLAGIGLSTIGMGLAAAGLLVPVAGALFQEAIDVAVILNALRALRG
jgi:heavy metal translocating P-type ATPase